MRIGSCQDREKKMDLWNERNQKFRNIQVLLVKEDIKKLDEKVQIIKAADGSRRTFAALRATIGKGKHHWSNAVIPDGLTTIRKNK